MQASAQLNAAIEILQHWHEQPQSLSLIAKAWARGHRFAGAKDRAAIMDMVFQSLRVATAAAAVFTDSEMHKTNRARGEVLGSLALQGMTVEQIAALCTGPHAAPELSETERACLERAEATISAQSEITHASLPGWLWPMWKAQYGVHALDFACALQQSSSLDVRVNALRASNETRSELAALGFEACQFPNQAMRFSSVQRMAGKRPPNLQQHPRFLAGEFEIQDRSSQIAIALCDIKPGTRILDLCAGAGGKSLGLAAKVANECEIHTFDISRSQQADLQARVLRNGASCIQIIPTGDQHALKRRGRFDVVLLDAPCSGSGTWRRSPDAKWRFTPEHLALRIQQQRALLEQAIDLLKPGGVIYYWTCSLLSAENQQQIDYFLNAHPRFRVQDWRTLPGAQHLFDANPDRLDLALSPRHHDCDGFFFAKLVLDA